MEKHFTLLDIDHLIDGSLGHQTLSFIDAYSGYNQIRMDRWTPITYGNVD